MIIKLVPEPKRTSARDANAYARLARYVVNADGGVDPMTWKRTADYILDTKNNGEKTGYMRVTNCLGDDPADAAREIMNIQSLNRRSTSPKQYHVVVSFPAEEVPEESVMRNIESEICATLGMQEHQRLSAVHIDTDHFHMHIAINKIHPRTHRNVTPYYPHRKLMTLAERLEIEHGLRRTNHGELAALPAKPSDMEAHSGEMSLTRWIKEKASPDIAEALQSGNGWAGLHKALAAHDLEIRPRGAGLVIGVKGNKKLSVKASDIARELSFKSLKGRFGDYVPPSENARVTPVKDTYAKKALQTHKESAGLYAAYQREREEALSARREQSRISREARKDAVSALSSDCAARLKSVRRNGGLSYAAKKRLSLDIRAERSAGYAALNARAAEERASLREAHPLPTWNGFLMRRADNGDCAALSILRSKAARERRASEALLCAETAEEARDIVFRHLKPKTAKNGAVFYRTEDGGRVIDDVSGVHVAENSAGAAFLALSLAAERYGDKRLVVAGDDVFKEHVARMAALEGTNIRFADAAMESERLRLTEEPAARAEASRKGKTIGEDGLTGADKETGRTKPKGRKR